MNSEGCTAIRWAVTLSLLIISCSPKVQQVSAPYWDKNAPPPPDYSRIEHWASLPQKKDAADSVPLNSRLWNQQAGAAADVFFIYPTIYTGKPDPRHPWNADVNDRKLNREIQGSTILNQASIFNGSCRIYSPYYRQAHLYAFYTRTDDGKKALDLAYADVRAAFLYYMEHFNQGRPLVIASHSQGSRHGVRLLEEFFDGKELQKQLVVAYLVGRPIPKNVFKAISPGESPDETGVWVSWNTFARDFIPANYDQNYPNALSVNPLLWNTTEAFAGKELNKGGVALRFTMVPKAADAQNHRNLLWINKPYVNGRAFLRTKVWHRADFNLFYQNVRDNVDLRLKAYLGAKSMSNK